MKTFRIVLMVLISIATLSYIIFVIDLIPDWHNHGDGFNQILRHTELYLFLLFFVAIYFLWKNELVSGVLLVAWHAIQWALVWWVWEDGGMTLILGFPIFLLGLLLIFYGIRKKMILGIPG